MTQRIGSAFRDYVVNNFSPIPKEPGVGNPTSAIVASANGQNTHDNSGRRVQHQLFETAFDYDSARITPQRSQLEAPSKLPNSKLRLL